MTGGRTDPQALFNKAMAALDAGDAAKAARLARKLSKVAPRAADAWQLRALIAQKTGAHGEAVTFLRRAHGLQPNDGAILNNLGNAYRELEKFEPALDAYERSLAARPGHPDTAQNLGNVLMRLGRFSLAENAFEHAARAQPDDYGILLNLAAAGLKQAKLEEAHAIYRNLLDLGHQELDVYHGLFQTSLWLGRWREAWQAYGERWAWQMDDARPFAQPWWRGEPLAGKSIVAWGEQGVGDEVMFASMVPDLAVAADRVIVECDARLVTMFTRSFDAVTCVAREGAHDPVTGSADYQVPLSSLGSWFRASEPDFGGGRPFLAPDRARAARLRQAYSDNFGDGAKPFLVGLAWQSLNRDVGDLKSMTLNDLAPVLGLPGVTFVNLQYGDTETQRINFHRATGITVHHDPAIDPLVDLDGHAAQLAAMDLVISVSNSSVHLGGAMGVPVWAVIQKVPDRRWLADRDDSPWYGSVRLFRQEIQGDWRAPVDRVAGELAALVGTVNRTDRT